MATDGSSRVRQAAKLAIVLLVVTPVLVQWGFVGADLVPAADLAPQIDADLLVRLGGLGLMFLVLVALVRQKRRTRGQQASERAPEEAADRQVEQTGVEQTGGERSRVEGSGEPHAPFAYNNQQQARREGERIRNRAEEIIESDRESRKRR